MSYQLLQRFLMLLLLLLGNKSNVLRLKREDLEFGLLVEQKKHYKDITGGSGKPVV